MHQVTQTLQWVVRSWTDLENSIVAVERVQSYVHTPKEVTGGRRGGDALDGHTREGSRPRSMSCSELWSLSPFLSPEGPTTVGWSHS